MDETFDQIHGMSQDEIINLLKEKSMEWKNILMHNCITLTKVYEREGELLE